MVTLKDARTAMIGKVAGIEPRLPADQITSGTGTTVTAKINTLGTWADDMFVDTHWLVLPNGPTGSGILEVQAVSDFDQADGSNDTIVTVNEPYSAIVASGVSAYVSPFHPEDVRRSLNIAATVIYPNVYVPRRYHHVSGSWAYNGFWDLWASGLPAFWKRSSENLSVDQLNTPYFGPRGVTLTADSGGPYDFEFSAPYPALLNELAGESISLHAIMSASSASSGGVLIADGDGDDLEVQHDGDGTWAEVQTAKRTIVQAGPTSQITWKIRVAASQTVYLGPVWTEGGPTQTNVLIPDVFRRAPAYAEMETNAWPNHRQNFEPEDDWLLRTQYPTPDAAGNLVQSKIAHFTNGITPSKRLMAFGGEDYLAEAALETDVYELESQHETLFYTLAIVNLKEQLGELLGSGAEEWQQRMARNWFAIYNSILKQPGQRMARKPVAMSPAVSSRPLSAGGWSGPDDR